MRSLRELYFDYKVAEMLSLLETSKGPVRYMDFRKKLGFSDSVISKGLDQLKISGLLGLEVIKDGRHFVAYKLSDKGLRLVQELKPTENLNRLKELAKELR